MNNNKELNEKIVLEYLRSKLKYPKCFYCKRAVKNGQYILNCMGEKRFYHSYCLDVDILELVCSDEKDLVEDDDIDKEDTKIIVHYSYA
jgi:hypothetical protein